VTGQLLTAEQLAERWHVPKSHVYRLAREGRIPTVELGRYRRFRLDEIERYELGADTVGDHISGRGATDIAPRPYP
jgi:excisionase family DNA binding protein